METLYFDLSSEQIRALVPILFLCGMTLLSLVTAAFRVRGSVQRTLGTLGFLVFVAFSLSNISMADQTLMGTSLFLGLLSKFSAIVIGTLALATCLFVEENDHPEWLPLLNIAVVGLCLVVSARDWVSFFIYLETFAMPSYVLASLRLKKDAGFEAGLKYLMIGAFSSAIFLLGITFVYGYSGSFDYLSILESIRSANTDSPVGLLYAGFALIIISIGFKVALAPFHMWAPDVYQSAPAALASFLATAVKFAVFVAAFAAFSQSGLLQIPFFQAALSAFGILSILVGNLMALRQTNLRRMLAYASVASAGNAAVAFAVGPTALSSVLVYLAIYGLNIVAFFALIEWSARSTGLPSSSQADIKTLSTALNGRPVLMFSLGVILFSLVGLPPLPGFFGKFLILRDLLRAGLFVEVGAILVGSLMALAYYLKIFVPLVLEEKTPTMTTTQAGVKSASVPMVGVFVATLILLGSCFSLLEYFKVIGDTSLFLR